MPDEVNPPTPPDSDETTRGAVTRLALATLAEARASEAAVLESREATPLHDYRVSLRRLRSLLSSLRGVYPEEPLTRWKVTLKEAASATGRIRDLDVHLLSRKKTLTLLPQGLRKGTITFFSALNKEREAAYRSLGEHLSSAAYSKAMTGLARELAGADALPATESGSLPILQQAAGRTLHRLHQLGKRIDRITASSSDEEIHQTRILGKKLRYLLDFFGGLFPGKAAKSLAKDLARLQGKLGRFNDTTVQQQTLSRYTSQRQRQLAPATLLSMGGLMTAYSYEHQRLREKALKALAEFAQAPSLRRLRKQLAALAAPATPSDEPATY